jgi:ABC-2 type transport system permease protein
MTAVTLSARNEAGVPPTSPGGTLVRLALRQIRRGALIVALVCSGMSAIVAVQYQSMFEGGLTASGLQALSENPAIRILFGTPVALDDAGGFTVWRTSLPVLVLASVWILLAATRITRGEEDAGRLDLLLSGRLTMVDVVARCLIAVTASAMVISVALGAALAAAGTNPTGSVVYAATVLGVTLTFATAATLAAQVMPTRSSAIGVTVAFLGLSLMLRMLADGASGLAWVAWTTPFGLTARVAPYADNRVLPLLVLFAFTIVLGIAGIAAARHRDVGSGLVAVAARRRPRTGLLGSVTGFALRRAIPPTIAWAVAIASYFALVGALTASILEFFDANHQFAELAAAAGFAGLDSGNGFAAALFSLLAIPTGLYNATRLAGMVADEKARRWTPLFATQTSRIRLVGNEVAVTAAGMALLHVIAGFAIWTGSAITGGPLTVHDALAGAMNSAPIAWLAVGAATLAVGWMPSAVGGIGAVPVAGGFLLYVLADSAGAPAWVAGMSPFAHLAAVPNAAPNWAATTAFLLIGVGLVAVGITGYAHRDLTT